VGHIGVTAIDSPGADHPEGRFASFHGANLNRRGVSTQKRAGVKIEGIVHGTGRVMAGNIEGFEVVVIVFDFRPLLHRIAGFAEELFDALESAGDRVQPTQILTTTGQGHINRFTGKLLLQGLTFQIIATGVDCLFYLTFGLIDFLASGRALFSGKFAQSFCLLGNDAFFAKVLYANLIQRFQIPGFFDRFQTVLNELIQVFH
jgi:hypothetical protein